MRLFVGRGPASPLAQKQMACFSHKYVRSLPSTCSLVLRSLQIAYRSNPTDATSTRGGNEQVVKRNVLNIYSHIFGKKTAFPPVAPCAGRTMPTARGVVPHHGFRFVVRCATRWTPILCAACHQGTRYTSMYTERLITVFLYEIHRALS